MTFYHTELRRKSIFEPTLSQKKLKGSVWLDTVVELRMQYFRDTPSNTFFLYLKKRAKLLTEVIKVFRLFKLTHHCKLTRRRSSNSIDITVTTLWPRCSSMSDLSHMCKKSKFFQLHLKNTKRFCSFQFLFKKKSYDKKHLQFQCYLHFTLVWRELLPFSGWNRYEVKHIFKQWKNQKKNVQHTFG